MKRSQRHALVLLTLMAGCGGESLHLGNDDPEPGTGGTGTGTGGTAISAGGTGAGGGASVELPLSNWPDQDGCSSDPELAGLLGAWEGQLEDFFLMPVEAIRIVINGASATGICGSVTWGNLPPLEPATDPDAVYPPEPYWDMPGWGGSPSATVIPGVPYTIVSGGARCRSCAWV